MASGEDRRMARSVSHVTLLVLGLLAPWPTARADGDLDEPAVARLVERWVSAADPQSERDTVLAQLRLADPVLAEKTARRLLAVPASRQAALVLAAELRIPGLFSTVRPWIDGEYEQQIVELLARSDDVAAHEFLLARFRAAEPGSMRYELLRRAFCEHGLVATGSLLRMESLVRSAPEPVCDDAAAILAFQMAAPAGTNRETLLAAWPRLADTYQRSSRRQPLRGTSLMGRVATDSQGIRRVGPNIMVQPGGMLRLGPLPDAVQAGNWRLGGWVRVFSSDGCDVELAVGTGHAWRIQTVKGEWIVQEKFGSQRFAKVVPGEWTEVEYAWIDESAEKERYARVASASAAGIQLLERGTLNGRITFVTFHAGPEHPIVVGGVGYSRPSR